MKDHSINKIFERDKRLNVEKAKYIPCNRVSFYIHGYYAFSKADVYSLRRVAET